MRFDVLEKILVDAGLGTVGVDIFSHHMPGQVNEGILMRAPLTGIKFDHYLPGYYKTAIQVIVRSQATDAGQTKTEAVLDAFTRTLSKTYSMPTPAPNGPSTPVMKINQFLPQTLPIIYPRSVGNGLEFSLHFDAVYVILA